MDIVIKDWNHLMEVIFDIPVNKYGRRRSNFVYRGMSNAKWKLETSLIRLGGNFQDVEKPMLRSLRKYSEPGWLLQESVWMDMTIGQHHGLPTRLLDWTNSPQVAAHFATHEFQFIDDDAVIWLVDIGAVHQLLPQSLLRILHNEYAWLFSLSMLSTIKTLEDFDNLGRDTGEFLLFFEPPSLDARIANQAGVMSVMPNSARKIDDFLVNYPHVYKRVIIPASVKKEVRDKLDQSNVTERMLFPGLDGLSTYLKRYYETW